MAKVIMVQGTMSNSGKSFLVAGLCRIFRQDGYRVAPFKSQNMALNSYITDEGLEMGRAQVMQAEAAGIKPMVCMNPVLLKPTNNTGSQVIVNGRVLKNMPAREYFAYKKTLIPDIKKAFKKLEEYADIIVIEGAGSPAEINLKENIRILALSPLVFLKPNRRYYGGQMMRLIYIFPICTTHYLLIWSLFNRRSITNYFSHIDHMQNITHYTNF